MCAAAFTGAERLKADSHVQAQARRAAGAASRAIGRTRRVGVAEAASDRRVLSELRAAAEAMARVAANAKTPKQTRGRAANVAFGVGMIGAGAYAGYRAFRSDPTKKRAFTPSEQPAQDPSAFVMPPESRPQDS